MSRPGPERFSLSGRVAVVTGGSRGIGRAIALALADAGASVVVASRDEGACGRVAAEIAELGVRGVAVQCDATSEAQVATLFERVASELGGTDVLIHCAGLQSSTLAREVERDELRRMMDVHYYGAITAAQRARSQMKDKGGGAIVFVTSVFGLGGTPTQLAYGSAKAALAHAVKVLAVEWARDGVRVNGLAPGFVDTDMTADLPSDTRERLLRRIPMRRAATPDEMAGPAVMLCSDAASYITGQVLAADGGELAR